MKIICIGRNYVEHAKELNNKVPSKPVFFMKPDTSLLLKNQPFYLPDFSDEIHYELEVVVKINKLGKCISEKFAHRYYSEVALGVDFTARDLQRECKEKGLPWEIAKGFEKSAPLSKFVNLDTLPKMQNIDFNLDINGKTVQVGNTEDMIFSVDKLIAYLSNFFPLKIGDLIYTGTPAGVGKIFAGDRLEGYLHGDKLIDFKIR